MEHLSFGLDVKCFFGTIAAVLKHDGVVEGGTGTLHEEKAKTPESGCGFQNSRGAAIRKQRAARAAKARHIS